MRIYKNSRSLIKFSFEPKLEKKCDLVEQSTCRICVRFRVAIQLIVGKKKKEKEHKCKCSVEISYISANRF